ncbi:hypothetical protein AVEN_220233-1 [Araneus ventricosus]|uniref:Uncharacterized protein n=1 Tax=Araneus ventricosus TaxID=182803 RepID=A0A4Y2HFD9_ARAVE|nr:hypothetical protein AVEN_220233-1 [Araneus ventricosus]
MRDWGIRSPPVEESLTTIELFLGVISDQQPFSLESPKHVLLGSCLENMLTNAFEGFLRRKGNCPLAEHDVTWRYRPREWIHPRLLQRKGPQ